MPYAQFYCSFNCYEHFLWLKLFELYKGGKWQTIIAFCLFYSFRFLKTLMGWSQKLDYDWFIFDEAHMIFYLHGIRIFAMTKQNEMRPKFLWLIVCVVKDLIFWLHERYRLFVIVRIFCGPLSIKCYIKR